MPSIYLNYPSDSACVYHRFVEPARFCRDDWEKVGCAIDLGEGIPDKYTWIGFHSLPTAMGFQAIMMAKNSGMKLLWSLDDDFATIPDFNPAKRNEAEMLYWHLMKQHADLIICSTHHLASTLEDVADKVMVAPNLCDLSRFPTPPPIQTDEKGHLTSAIEVRPPIRVVWTGSVTHRGDIQIIENAVDKVLRRVGARDVRFVFFGMYPPGNLIRDHLHRGVLYQAPVAFGDYRQAINNLRPDVWLAPLADIPFNYSKSNLRIMEGWALNAAVAASTVGEYNCLRSGVDGRLCGDEEAWVSALTRLVTDHQHRLEIAIEGRRRVEESYNWSRRECRRPWDAVWSRIFETPIPE